MLLPIRSVPRLPLPRHAVSPIHPSSSVPLHALRGKNQPDNSGQIRTKTYPPFPMSHNLSHFHPDAAFHLSGSVKSTLFSFSPRYPVPLSCSRLSISRSEFRAPRSNWQKAIEGHCSLTKPTHPSAIFRTDRLPT